ncbi:hypothetical protein QYF36_015432 [Acer negundo]|nr:hypothetical protein QYF36_015432 [Acer negundo]
MALRFPRFSQGLAQDPTTRRIWFGIATAHDFESHDDITEERLYQNIFASHFGQLAIIFLWTSGNLFHVAWQGNFEAWVQDPLHELIETLAWAHERTPLANLIRWRDKPVALSIVQARLVGLAHFSVGYIFTYAAFLIASTSGKFG